jgi:hypothetical protein
MTFQEKRASSFSWAFGNIPAIALSMLGIAAAGLALVGAGGGFEGWTMIAIIAAVVLFGLAAASYFVGLRLRGSEVVTYAPDNPPVRFDVDQGTGERRPHREA